MAIQKKSTASSGIPKKQVLKVNPYENPDTVLELMAGICSAKASAETKLYWDIINNAYYDYEVRGKSLYDYISENCDNLWNKDFARNLDDFCINLAWNLSTHENTAHTQVVVAGGFSSGKSSFLNRLTNSANLLPTGVEPISVVKTYLYCSKQAKSIAVQGVNLKNVLVTLDPNVLQAIQHANKSHCHLASVLDKLFVEIPSQKYDGLVFIDTPGYNNSDKENQSNGKTDRQTALEALKEGNVLFWLVDCERGTTVSADIEFIKHFEGKKVFIFNKADKKGEKECVEIVEEAAQTLYKEFPKEDIIDIIAFSTLDNRIYYSKNKKTLDSIIENVKKSGSGISGMKTLRGNIEALFEDEIVVSKNTIKGIEEDYKEKLDSKNKRYEEYQSAKEEKDDIIECLHAVLVDGYNDMLSVAEKLTDSLEFAVESFGKFYNGVQDFEDNDHWGTSTVLNRAIDKAKRDYDKAKEKRKDAIDYNYYLADGRQKIVDKIEKEEDFVVDQIKEWYEEACIDCENALNNKTNEEKIIKDMSDYKRIFMSAVDMGVSEYRRNNKATSIHRQDVEEANVFECIKKDNYKLFLRCFETGVDMTVCNTDGYSPLTLAVDAGNNAMVQFMLSHGADPSVKDRRGYNALHTAVENQYRDICKILLDYDPDLIDTKTNSGESVEDLAQKHTFTKWIENEIYNAI